jgi:hypothetical protein
MYGEQTAKFTFFHSLPGNAPSRGQNLRLRIMDMTINRLFSTDKQQ